MNQGHTRFETRTTDDLLTVTCLGCNLDLVFAPGAPLRQRETAMLLHAQNANAAPRERRSASADKWSAYASGEREAARELRRRGLAPISGGSDVWAVYSAAQQGDPSASRELRRRAQSARHAAIEVEAAERLPRRSRAQRRAHRATTKRQRRQARMTLRDAIAQAESEALAELSERGLPPISGGCELPPQSRLMVRIKRESPYSETFDAECLDHRPQWRSAGNPTKREAMLALSEHVEHEHGAAMAHCVDCERIWMLSESQDGQLRCHIHADAWFGDRQCPICRDNLKTDGMTICRECAAETGRTPKALINRQAIDKQDVRLTDLFGQAPGVLLKAANFDRQVCVGIADSRPVAMPTQIADSRKEIRNEAGEWEYSHLGSVMDHLSLLIAALPAKGKFPKYAHNGQDWQVAQRYHNRQSPEQSRALNILLPAGQALAYTSAHWSSRLSAITVNVSAAQAEAEALAELSDRGLPPIAGGSNDPICAVCSGPMSEGGYRIPNYQGAAYYWALQQLMAHRQGCPPCAKMLLGDHGYIRPYDRPCPAGRALIDQRNAAWFDRALWADRQIRIKAARGDYA